MLFFSPYRYRGQLYSIIYGQAIPSVIGQKSVALTVIGTIEEVYGITFDGACEKLIQYLEIKEKGADTVEVEGYEDIESLLKEIDEKYPYYELDTEEEDLKNDELAEKVECGLWDKEIDKIIIEDVDEGFFDDLDLEEAEPSIYGNMDIEDLINVIEV